MFYVVSGNVCYEDIELQAYIVTDNEVISNITHLFFQSELSLNSAPLLE